MKNRRPSYRAAPEAPGEYPDDVAVSEPDPAVTLTQRTAYYFIRGSTLQDLVRQMNELGASQNGGARSTIGRIKADPYVPFGSCQPAWTWRFDYDQARENACALKSFHVDLGIIVTLPRWERPVKADPALVERFRRYFNHVQVHENGHRDIFIEQWKSFAAQARRLPAAATCAELNDAISALAGRLNAESEGKNHDYDEATYLGRTQNSWNGSF